MQKHPNLGLIEHFKDLPDPRLDRTKDHELIDVLTIAICTLLCAGESFNNMEDFSKAKEGWFKTLLNLKNGIPSNNTFSMVFAALCPQAFGEFFLAWTQKSAECGGPGDRGTGRQGAAPCIGRGSEQQSDRQRVGAEQPDGAGTLVVGDSLHWVLDVQMREDESRARKGHAAENLATLRHLALNLLKREATKKRGIKGKQLDTSLDHAYLLRLLDFPIWMRCPRPRAMQLMDIFRQSR